MSTEDVLNHHLGAFSEGDVDEIMKDFTEESTLILPEASLKGLETIRNAFVDFFGGLFKPGTYKFSLDRVEVVGDIAYIVWHSENEGADITLGTDTFLIQDGKIVVQTFALKLEAK
jgi:ketosteroid isomerase-like protein